ncbi:hypothetical protein [Halorussus halobius]|uniref:hypothetical protein n=1 Tax=Halorussus halobius TaxID=1710537 RepID=UPI0010927E57|nr:hypothetical protein [Halorussus halobius]
MTPPSWLRRSVQIARVEHARSRRRPGRSSAWRAVLAIALVGLSIGGGVGAYVFGQSLAAKSVSVPVRALRTAVVAASAMFLWTGIQGASRRIARLNVDHLLTTVRVREVVLGIGIVEYAWTVAPLSPVVLGVAAGFAVGTGSPASAGSIGVAVAGLVGVTTVLGIAVSFATTFATLRSPRLRRYRNYAYVAAFLLGLLVWTTVVQGPVSNERVVDWLRSVPFAWFVDLGLLAAPNAEVGFGRGLAALGLTIIGVPVLTVIATGFADRALTTDSVSTTAVHRSRPLVGNGLAEYAFAGWVPRPALTVARKRWTQERRLPRGLLYQGFVLLVGPVVYLPILATGAVPAISVVALASLCAVGAVLAFGVDCLGAEYASLPMTLTTVPGRRFVQGTVLAATTVSTPITFIAVVGIGVWSPLSRIELVLTALAGVALSVAGVLFVVALGLRVSYYDFQPISIPFTDMTVHTDRNVSFRLVAVLVLVGLLVLPATVTYGMAFVGGTRAPAVTAGAGSLLVTVLLAAGVSLLAYRRSVRAYEQYALP